MADWNTCPKNPGPARDEWMLEAIRAGEAQAAWREVSVEASGHSATFFVTGDALMIDGVRINVSAELQQKIADVLGALLLTPQIADLIWQQRTWTVPPFLIPPVNGGIPMDTPTMIAQSGKIDAALTAQGYDGSGIVQTAGKHWVLSSKMSASKACNYGWHFLGSGGYNPATKYAAGARVWQPPSTMHNPQHTDYSQTCTLVARNCTVDGHADFDLEDVLQSPELWPLASSEGPVPTRQPGVGEETFAGSGLLPLPPHASQGSDGIWQEASEFFEESPVLATALVAGATTVARHFAPDILAWVKGLWRSGKRRLRSR